MTSAHEEDAESRVLKMHPLQVSLTIMCGKSDQHVVRAPQVKVQLYFHHMSTMNMITVKGVLTENTTINSIAAA